MGIPLAQPPVIGRKSFGKSDLTVPERKTDGAKNSSFPNQVHAPWDEKRGGKKKWQLVVA